VAKIGISGEYANFLNTIDWTHWCTFTTRYDLSMKSARRMSEVIFNKFSKQDIFNQGDQKMFWAAEPFDVKNGYHIHALIQTELSPEDIYKWTNKRFGRTLILPYEKEKGAHSYCSKYILKKLSDYDLYFKK
jgi:hypothetical protein